MKAFQPLAVLFSYRKEDGAVAFLGRSSEIVIHDYAYELIQILKHCNGQRTIAEIRDQARIENDIFDVLIDTCTERGIIRDSRELLYGFHEDSANPMPFAPNISPDEINQLVNRPRPRLDLGTPESVPSPDSQLLSLIRARQSVRGFSKTPVEKSLVFGLLESMYALGIHRSTPSAGKLYPLEIYVAVSQSQQLPSRIYRYDPKNITLTDTGREISEEKLARALDLPSAPGAMTLFITGDLRVSAYKYGNRGYRYALLEAGHAAQNAYLFAAENSLGVLEFGGFDDQAAAKMLGLNFPRQAVLTTLIVGHPDPNVDQIDLETSNKLWQLQHDLVGPGKPVEWVAQTNLGKEEYALDRVLAVARYHNPSDPDAESRLSNECYGISTDSRIARIKALAEAFERYASGTIRHDHVGPARNLETPWLDPRIFTPFQPKQYPLLSDLIPFDPQMNYQWVAGYRHNSQEKVLVPVEHAFYPVRPQDIGRIPCYSASSSGVAAHFDYNQALEHAMLELIERDAIAVTWYAKREVPAIHDGSLSDSVWRRMRKWQELGWEVKLLNITTDSVPVVMALMVSHHIYPHVVSGACAAYDYKTASSRALEEAETMLTSWRFADPASPLAPEQVVSTLDHGKIYFQPENIRQLDWLRNSRVEEPPAPVRTNILTKFDPVVVELHLATTNKELHVVRVISEQLLPINFGYGCEHYRHSRLGMLGLKWVRGFPSFPHLFA